MLEDDLRQRKLEFEEQSKTTQERLSEALAEQQKNQILLSNRAEEALARARYAEEKLSGLSMEQEKDSALQ